MRRYGVKIKRLKSIPFEDKKTHYRETLLWLQLENEEFIIFRGDNLAYYGRNRNKIQVSR